MKTGRIISIGIAALILTHEVQAQYNTYDFWDKNYTVQALLGAVKFDNLKLENTDGSADPLEVDVSLIPQLGGAWGTLPKGSRFQYGLETSFLLGLRIKDVNYASVGGSGLYISLSTSMWTFDLAGGGYASLFIDRDQRVRLYAAGGPLMMYVDYSSEREETDPGGTEETFDSNDSAFGIGVYARTGFEFRLYEKGMLGLGARGTWAHINLSDMGGRSELAGLAAFVTFTAGF